jgi:hypothetical protein
MLALTKQISARDFFGIFIILCLARNYGGIYIASGAAPITGFCIWQRETAGCAVGLSHVTH